MTILRTHHFLPFMMLISMVVLSGCKGKFERTGSVVKDVPLSLTDPYSATMVHGEKHVIDPTKPHIITGSKGTSFAIPEGCFVYADGSTVSDPVEVTIAEALTVEEQILSGINSVDHGITRGSEGAVYISATANGEALEINREKPVVIRLATKHPLAGIQAMKGTREADGSMKWSDPQPAEVFLELIDPALMNFFPDSFEIAVKEGLPFRNYSAPSTSLTDSLYYAFAPAGRPEAVEMAKSHQLNEPYYNPQGEVINGKYTSASYDYSGESVEQSLAADSAIRNYGIDPALIKTIRQEKYYHTFLYTKAFDNRLRVIFRSCNNKLLEIYLQHLDEPLYVADSLAAAECSEISLRTRFLEFASLKQTNIQDAGRYAALLSNEYRQEWQKFRKELDKARDKYEKALMEKSAAHEQLEESYRKLLFKRESFRMEKYNCTWTNVGWVNFMNIPPNVFEYPIDVKIGDAKKYDRLYVYAILSEIKSIGRLNSKDNQSFYFGDINRKVMPIPQDETCFLLAVGYVGEEVYTSTLPFLQQQAVGLSMSLRLSSEKELSSFLRKFGDYRNENSIRQDLEYMRKFYTYEQDRRKAMEETEFMNQLRRYVFPCDHSSPKQDGAQLFRQNCAACHFEDSRKLVGPGLAGATSRYSKSWLISWTRNASALIEAGDERAVSVFNKNGKLMQPSFGLTDNEIEAIYKYIDSTGRK